MKKKLLFVLASVHKFLYIYYYCYFLTEGVHFASKEKELSNEIRNLRSKVSSTRDCMLKEVIFLMIKKNSNVYFHDTPDILNNSSFVWVELEIVLEFYYSPNIIDLVMF